MLVVGEGYAQACLAADLPTSKKAKLQMYQRTVLVQERTNERLATVIEVLGKIQATDKQMVSSACYALFDAALHGLSSMQLLCYNRKSICAGHCCRQGSWSICGQQ